MSSPVALCNKAIALVGGNLILSLDDDQTEAKLCKAAYSAVRDKVLEDRVWTFAAGRTMLIPDATPPAFGYTYRFLIPSTWVRVVKVTGASEAPRFDWVREGNYILCNEAKIKVKFTLRVEDVAAWSPAAYDAFSYALAAEIAVPLTENAAMMERMYSLYDVKITDAAATDGAQGTHEQLRSYKLTSRTRTTGGA